MILAFIKQVAQIWRGASSQKRARSDHGRLHYLWRAVDQDDDVLDIRSKAEETRKPRRSSSASHERRCNMSRVIITGQAEELQCGEGRSAAGCRALPGQGTEQSGREFTSANQVAGASDETVQVNGPRAVFSPSLRDHHLTLPAMAASL